MSAADGFKFTQADRIKRHLEFSQVMKRGRFVGDRTLQIWSLPNGRAHSRLGLVIGKRHGGAVTRNRIKRILREAFRQSRERLPAGYDFACAVRAGRVPTLEQASSAMVRLTKRSCESRSSDCD